MESIPYRKRFFSYSLTVTNPMQPAGIPSKIISNHNYQQEQMLLVEYIWTKCMKGGIRFNRGVRYSVQSTAGHTNEISFAFYMSILFSIVGRIYYSILSIASSISLTPSHIFYLSWKSFKSTSVYEFKLNYKRFVNKIFSLFEQSLEMNEKTNLHLLPDLLKIEYHTKISNSIWNLEWNADFCRKANVQSKMSTPDKWCDVMWLEGVMWLESLRQHR